MHVVACLPFTGCKFQGPVLFPESRVGIRGQACLSGIGVVTNLPTWWRALAVCKAQRTSLCVLPRNPFIKHLAVLNSNRNSNGFTAG